MEPREKQSPPRVRADALVGVYSVQFLQPAAKSLLRLSFMQLELEPFPFSQPITLLGEGMAAKEKQLLICTCLL